MLPPNNVLGVVPTVSTTSYSKVQTRVTPQICPLIYYSVVHCIYRPFTGVKHMLTRTLPNLKLFMAWHSRRKSNFLEMSDVIIYSLFDMHVPKWIALQVCPSITITLN